MTLFATRFASDGGTRLDGAVEMIHGSGGRATTELVRTLFHRHFDNAYLAQGNDQAAFDREAAQVVMTTDAHVVSPLFFLGGHIGSLAVQGTINYVAMAGARPLYLSAAFILEEGFPLRDLERIVASTARASRDASVPVITDDTKVVEKGKGDGVFITTTGVGIVPAGVNIGDRAKSGDAILVSGTVGDHGVAVLSKRENLTFETGIVSDSAAQHGLVAEMVAAVPALHCLRDPTRGGLAATLNEIAQQSGAGMRLVESAIPVKVGALAACELLGLDPLYIANEGKLVAICEKADAGRLLDVMRRHPLGLDAALIGEVLADPHAFISMKTRFGGSRMVDWLAADPLPRNC